MSTGKNILSNKARIPILHVLFVADADSKYGAPNSLFGLVRALKKKDNSLKISIVLTRHSDRMEDFEKIDCDVYQIPYVPFYQAVSYNKLKLVVKYVLRGLEYLYGRIFAVSILEKQLDLSTVDIIHANSSREDFGAILAKKNNKPLVWHIREFGDLDYRCYSYRRNYISFMRENATVFVAVSDAVRQHWIEKGIPDEKIKLIYNGVKENTIHKDVENLEQKRGDKDDSFQMVMMGSICETKGQHQIIKAMALLSENYKKKMQLHIVGDGVHGYVNVLKRLVKSLHLENNVHFLGYQKNFYPRLASYDCGIMCSKSEGFGRVTVEYMRAGLPVLASDTGANIELVEEGKSGLLYHYPDVEDLRDKLVYLMEHREEVLRMSVSAFAAGERFTEERTAKAVYNLYLEIMERKGC